MSITQIKENIVNLLENIIRRSEMIEKQSGSRNLMDIDIAMEDIRLLYREMDRLRKFTEAEGFSPIQSKRDDKSEAIRDVKPVQTSPDKQPSTDTGLQGQKVVPENVAKDPGLGEKPHIHKEEPVEKEEPLEDTQPATPGITTITEDQPVKEEPSKEDTDTGKEKEKDKELKVESEKTAPPKVKKETLPAENIQLKPRSDSNGSGIVKTAEPSRQLVGEKFSSGRSSVHERLAQIRDDKSIGARMQQKPVSSIKEAIGINEKFLFINELFSGDLSAYNDAVHHLNNCPSIHEAFELLNRFTEEFHWDGQRSAETIEIFANLVQRRYM